MIGRARLRKPDCGTSSGVSQSLRPLNALFSQPACCSIRNNEQRLITELISELMDSLEEPVPGLDARKLARRLEQDAWLFDTPLIDQDIERDFQSTVVAYQYGP